MPLTIFPVPFLSDPNPKDKEQKPIVPPPSTRRAVTLKLPIEVARALKDASANAKPGGQPAVRVTLSGDKPGLTISGQLFPFDLALKAPNGPNNVAEIYSRTRHQYPRKPADHRPPLALQSVIVGQAVVEDAAQKLRVRMAEADQAKKDRRIQMLETPPATTSGAGAKASATGTKKKKNAAARTATASTLERDVLRKGVAMKATTAGPAASSSTSALSSNRASPSTANHKQTPASSSSTPTSPATSPVDTRPLEERIIHLLATKSQTIQELEGLLGANKDDISEILRRVATTHDQSSSSANWNSTPRGLWALKLSSYASLQPWTWPAYTDRDRQRIAGDMENAFDQSGLPKAAPERQKLQEGEARWKKKMAARSASGTPVPGTTQRKLKMNKISEPPNATGGTLSASSVKPGIVKSTSANGVPTTSTKKKAAKVNGTGSTKGSDVEVKEKPPKKRPSPTEPSRSGAATPMSASSSNGSTSSATSASAPLRHALPQKPQVNLGPPPTATQHARHNSHTPPPPRPSATPTQSPRPSGSAASPRVAASATSKRKLDDISDLDDVLTTSKTKAARSSVGAPSASNSIPQEAKRRKLEPSPLGAGSSTAPPSRTASTSSSLANGAVVKTKHEAGMREASGAASSSQVQQSLKPPPTQANGRAPRSGSVATTKSDRETGQLPKFGRKEPSPLGPSALSKSVNGKEKASHSAKAEERSHSRASGKGRATPVFTSSEEEEDPEEAAEKARRAAAKKKKLARAAAAAADTSAAPSPAPVVSHGPRLRKVKRLPSPLPTDRKELRLLHGEKYADMMTVFAELQAEKARAERCAAEQGDPSTLWSDNETHAKVNEYNALREQVAKIKEAVDASLRADGQQ